MQSFQPSKINNPKRDGVRLTEAREAPRSRKVPPARLLMQRCTGIGYLSHAAAGDSLAEEDEGEDDDDEPNKDASASEEEPNGDGENDDA